MSQVASGPLLRHMSRDKKENGEYYKWDNQDIDPLKTKDNYHLHEHNLNSLEFIKKRISEVKCHNRSDVNVLSSWILTAPRNDKNGDLLLGRDEQKQFFDEAYKFYSKQYGKENIVYADVHLDETTPHMHFGFVPVVTDKKKGHLKVSAKEAVTKLDLQQAHEKLNQHMIKAFGRDIGIYNGVTAGRNKSIDELKDQEYKKIDDLVTNSKKVVANYIGKHYKRDAIKIALESSRTSKLDSGNIIIPKKQFEVLKSASNAVNSHIKEMIKLEEDKKKLLADKKNLEKQNNKLQKDFNDYKKTNVKRTLNIETLDEQAKLKVKSLEVRENLLNKKEIEVDTLYNNQINLNDDFKALSQASSSFENSMHQLLEEREVYIKEIEKLESSLTWRKEQSNYLADRLVAVTQAVGALKYESNEPKYMANLNNDQKYLIDAIGNYSAQVLKDKGYNNYAKEVETTVSISNGIKSHIKVLEPSRDIGISR
jgi:hypothetical protein